MLDLGHEVQYTKTHEDLLYGSAAFSSIYGVSNFVSRIGAPQKMPGYFALGAHGFGPKSSFFSGFVLNAYSLTDSVANKMFGKFGWAQQMASREGLNIGAINLKAHSAKAFQAAGGYGSSVLPGINVSRKSTMAIYLNSTADFTEGITKPFSKEIGELMANGELEEAAKLVNKKASFNKAAYKADIIEEGAKNLKGVKGKKNLISAADDYAGKISREIAETYSDDALLKLTGGVTGSVLEGEAREAAIKKASEVIAGQVSQQVRNAAFAKTGKGIALSIIGKGASAVGKFLFSAPVQTILMGEMALNMYAGARTNNQIRNIKEYQGAKQAYFNNPATQSAIQKGGAIYQNNNNDLNFLLSSPNIATQLANRR